MQEETPPKKQDVISSWVVSLAISIFCCTVFSALVSYYVSSISKTLNTIDGRLANLEVRSIAPPPVSPATASVSPAPPPPEASDVPSAAPLGADESLAPASSPGSLAPPAAPAEAAPSAEPKPETEPVPSSPSAPEPSAVP